MGADAVIDPSAEDYVDAVQRLTDGRSASVTYMAIGVPSAIEAAVQGAAKRGIVSVYARVHPRGTTIQVDPEIFHPQEVIPSGPRAQAPESLLHAVRAIAPPT